VSVVARRIPGTYDEDMPAEHRYERDGVRIVSADWEAAEDLSLLRREYDAFQPDALVGATIYGSFDACRLDVEAPVWADQFGHVMAEAQAKAYVAGSNRYLRTFWRMEREVIVRGDVFSAVSGHQRFATVGELGAVGRLSRETLGYRFVRTIPCGLDPEPLRHERVVLRGDRVPEDAFVVLWSGSYNTWTDVDTLFEGLEGAMAADPDVWFVSTGGAVEGHDEVNYPRFCRLVERSRFRDRYVLLGWLPKREVGNYYFEADIGINIDKYMYEGLLGSKNRVLDWMRAGLPALVSDLPELARQLDTRGIGFLFPLGDATALAAAIVELAGDREKVRRAGRRAREHGARHLTFDETARPLIAWAEDPRPAPDRPRRPAPGFLEDLDRLHDALPRDAVERGYDALGRVFGGRWQRAVRRWLRRR
jgi:glycosyltransferase involved in cell wall biosynthesis